MRHRGHTVAHLLGPHVVGRRVVVRRRLPGESGRSGGPAMTDVLGVCESWADGLVVLRREDGSTVTVPVADIVSGKPVPVRPPMHGRVSARDLHVRGHALFPDLEVEPLGGWLLRHSPGHPRRRRPNSALALPTDAPPPSLADVGAWYAARGRRPVVCVLPGSAEEQHALDAGWGPESEDADSLFMVGSVARAVRLLGDPPSYAVALEGEDDVVAARFGDQATGRAVYADDWVGLAGVDVHPARRRRGLGLAVVAAMLEWGAERGARTAYLQVLADNDAALGLYERLGFTAHHAYRYLAPATT